MGSKSRQARQNLKKKEVTQARHEDVNGAMRQLRLSLMNMRQLYEGAVQEKLVLTRNVDEIKVMLAAVLLTESDGEGSVEITDDTLELANNIDGIQVEKTDEGMTVFVVMAPPEEEPKLDVLVDMDPDEFLDAKEVYENVTVAVETNEEPVLLSDEEAL